MTVHTSFALPAWYAYTPDMERPATGFGWSGLAEPPQLGDQVVVGVNGIGLGTVVGYFTESGFLGVMVLPKHPPAWYVKQNGPDAIAYTFGAELKEEGNGLARTALVIDGEE